MKKETKTKLIKILIIAICLLAIILAIYLPLNISGAMDNINNIEDLKEIIANGGVYSYLIFFILQFLQTTFLPIPAMVTTLAGTYVFGPWIALTLSIISVIIASIFSFFLGRKVGRKLVVWVAGEETTAKWQAKLEKGKYVFFLMMLLPVFPDDILCLVVGATTAMTYKFFIITNVITRPIAIACTCFLGSGILIPFDGWGIPVWIILIIALIIVFYVSIKYQAKIEEFINKLSYKLSKKNVAETASVNSEDKSCNEMLALETNNDKNPTKTTEQTNISTDAKQL